MKLSITLVVASSIVIFAAPHSKCLNQLQFIPAEGRIGGMRRAENVDKTWWKRFDESSQLQVERHENVDKTWWKRFDKRSQLQVGRDENVDKTWW